MRSGFSLHPNGTNGFVPWGRADVLFTPAYWETQVKCWGQSTPPRIHRLGQTMKEEAVACLLGGHGISAEVGLAAYQRLRERGLLAGRYVDDEAIRRSLTEPLILPDGRYVRYRFANVKGAYICELLARWEEPPAFMDATALRNWFLRFGGVGLKTSSWIVRNWLDSDDVAILDVHVIRAGLLAGFYSAKDRVQRDYLDMERRFLHFCRAVGGRPSIVDAIIWSQMRFAGFLAHDGSRR